jgi:hypothetical protein
MSLLSSTISLLLQCLHVRSCARIALAIRLNMLFSSAATGGRFVLRHGVLHVGQISGRGIVVASPSASM